jgi:YfiH family protein
VSQGDFAELNAAREKGDNLEHVQENRRRITETLGFDVKKLVTVRQVHSPKVLVVKGPFAGDPPEADALITTTPGLLIAILTADCVPILLSTPQGDIVAAIHAGWRGAVTGIIEETVREMKALGGKEIVGALGPCIWQESYEVSQEFYDNIALTPAYFKPGNRPDHWQFDLPGYVTNRLHEAGVHNISPSPGNTYVDPLRFFSYRRKTILGQQDFGCGLSGIGIRDKKNG